MFSSHVETVALLSLKTGQPKLEVAMEVDSDSNYTPEERATYQKIKAYVKEKYGVNVHTSYIAPTLYFLVLNNSRIRFSKIFISFLPFELWLYKNRISAFFI